MKKLLLLLLLSLGLIGSTWALQVSPTAIYFACENTGLVVEEVLYLRDDGRLCGESYNRIPESEEEAESQAKEWEECPISIPVMYPIPSEDSRCIEAEKKISSGEVFKSKVIKYQSVCEIIDGENTQKCQDLKSEQLSNEEPSYISYEEPTYHPTSIYIEKLIVLSELKCDGLTVNLEVEEISQNQIVTYEDGKICSKYFKGQRCYENTDEAIEIFENGACSPYFESADCYSLMEKFEFIEKNLEPDNPICIEAENSKTNAPSGVRNGYGEMVERYNYKTPKYGSFVTVTEVSDDGITETSYLDKDLYIKHGKDIYWWRVGQKGVEKNYDNNVLNGKYTSWYDNGQIMGEGNYKDGKIVGKYTFWHRNGQIDSERNY